MTELIALDSTTLARPNIAAGLVQSFRDGRLRRPTAIAQALVLSFLGRKDEVIALRGLFGEISDEEDEAGLQILGGLLELSVFLRDRASMEQLVRRLQLVAGRLQSEFCLSFGRLLGEAAALLGRPADARDFYAQAIEICNKVGFRPELALTRLDLAELLLAHYPAERKLAFEHLDFSIDEFHAMHMRPAEARAHDLRTTHADPATVGRATTRVPDDPLTAREREVAALVARGMSNREIGDALVISEGTAEVHVKRILSKLTFKSRSQVATWVTQRSMLPTKPDPDG